MPWTRALLSRISRVALAPMNGLMCRWEPPGPHLKDGPHTYATHAGWGADTVVGLFAVGATRRYRIHGIPWYHARGRREVVALDIPLREGSLAVLGGPLKGRWLYAQPRDEELLPERIQFTAQLHADPALRCDALCAPSAGTGTEDCEDDWLALSACKESEGSPRKPPPLVQRVMDLSAFFVHSPFSLRSSTPKLMKPQLWLPIPCCLLCKHLPALLALL